MIPSSIKLIAFDLDDTLWPCMPPIIAAEEALYQWLCTHYPLITKRYSFTSLMGARVDFSIKNPQWLADLSTMRRQFLAYLAQQCHYPAQQVADEGFKVFFAWRNKVIYFVDVIPALKRLSESYILATISNGNADVMQTGLAPYMHFSIAAGDVKKVKPDPKMFDVMVQRAGVMASQCLYCGDDAENDIVGARRSGWQACWVNRDEKTWPKQFGAQPMTIASLAEL